MIGGEDMKLLTKIFIAINLIIVSLLFVIYAPTFIKYQKKFVNEYAIDNKLSYLSYTFYNQEKMDSLIEEKIDLITIEEESCGDIIVPSKETISYDNEYEELVLSKDVGNEDYKVVHTKIGRNEAHLVFIYDPSKVHILTSKKFASADHYSGLETVKQMTKRLDASVGINGGGFRQDARTLSIDTPIGYVIKDGKIVWSKKGKGSLICMTNDNELKLLKVTGKEAIENYNVRDALEFGPFLIVDGEDQNLPERPGGYARSARSVIAQRRDGIIIFLVTEVKNGYTNGTTLQEIVTELKKYDVVNAANLDGGASTQLVVNGKVINKPLNIYNRVINGGNGRSLVTGWGLMNN